ncbi:hypothetical protein E4T56_gene13630 [Termitomyces sp. T112]|nr:hypothetical protein E4T56_gene13630 [Termitomyces sp. T112]
MAQCDHGDGRQRQQSGLDRQAGQGRHRRLLAHQSIAGKGCGQTKAPAQRFGRPRCQNDHACRCQTNGRPLRPVQLLTQQQCAQYHIHQRIDVIAKAGGKDMPALDHHDIGGPVRPDQQRRGRQRQHLAPVLQRGTQRCSLTQYDDRQCAGGKGEQRAPAYEFKRRHIMHLTQIERQQPPDQIGGNGIGHAVVAVLSVSLRHRQILSPRSMAQVKDQRIPKSAFKSDKCQISAAKPVPIIARGWPEIAGQTNPARWHAGQFGRRRAVPMGHASAHIGPEAVIVILRTADQRRNQPVARGIGLRDGGIEIGYADHLQQGAEQFDIGPLSHAGDIDDRRTDKGHFRIEPRHMFDRPPTV